MPESLKVMENFAPELAVLNFSRPVSSATESIPLHIFFHTETCTYTPALIAYNATFFAGLLFGAVTTC